MRRLLPLPQLLWVMMVFASRTAVAQTVRVETTDGESGRALAGAVVALQRADGSTLARAVTTEQGRATLFAATPAARVRVVRIGYRPFERALTAADTLPVRVSLVRLPTLLDAVYASARAHCPARPSAATALALWQQAQSVLLATVVARESAPSMQVRHTFERRMRGISDSVEQMRVDAEPESVAPASFSAVLSPEQFVRTGFVEERGGRRQYYGPDAEVLLSDAFTEGYCIDLAPPSSSRPTQMGVLFTPARRAKARIDIRGTLWIDTAARALRDIEFDYVGLETPYTNSRTGGRLSFRELPNGVVLVDQWSIRALSLAIDTIWQARNMVVPRVMPIAKDFGGVLVRATWPDLQWNAPLGALNVIARRAGGASAAGVTMSLVNTPHLGTTTPSGHVSFSALVAGPYQLVAHDSALTSIGWAMPVGAPIQLAEGAARTTIVSVPSVRDYILTRCASLEQDVDADGVVVLGRVLNAAQASVGHVTVTFAMRHDDAEAERLRLRVVTGTDGLFQICLPPDALNGVLEIELRRGINGRPLLRTEARLSSSTIVLPLHLRP